VGEPVPFPCILGETFSVFLLCMPRRPNRSSAHRRQRGNRSIVEATVGIGEAFHAP
jgi:hypothetical protein